MNERLSNLHGWICLPDRALIYLQPATGGRDPAPQGTHSVPKFSLTPPLCNCEPVRQPCYTRQRVLKDPAVFSASAWATWLGLSGVSVLAGTPTLINRPVTVNEGVEAMKVIVRSEHVLHPSFKEASLLECRYGDTYIKSCKVQMSRDGKLAYSLFAAMKTPPVGKQPTILCSKWGTKKTKQATDGYRVKIINTDVPDVLLSGTNMTWLSALSHTNTEVHVHIYRVWSSAPGYSSYAINKKSFSFIGGFRREII